MGKRNPFCIYCRRDLLAATATYPDGKPHGRAFTRDHIKPKSEGGKVWFPCCKACNQVKANLTVEEWDMFKARVQRWWELFPKYTARTYRN